MDRTKPWVVITGCSSGIGKALVQACREEGWGVVATARKVEALMDLPAGEDLRTVPMDVTDPQSLAAAVAACSDIRVVSLVNNAGYGQMGPLELLRSEELRAQFETNVIGLQAATNAFLPLIRAQAQPGEGRIVHVASVLGRLSIPMAGAYNASKHAVVALAETLRLEIGRDIAVILVEPGAIQTEFRATLKKAWGDMPERAEGTRYFETIHRYATKREDFSRQHGMSSEACARRIALAMASTRPPRRVVIGADSFWGQVAHRLLPASLFEWVMRRSYGV